MVAKVREVTINQTSATIMAQTVGEKFGRRSVMKKF